MSHETESHRDKTSQEQTVQEENNKFWHSKISKGGGSCICGFMAQQLDNRKARELGSICKLTDRNSFTDTKEYLQFV